MLTKGTTRFMLCLQKEQLDLCCADKRKSRIYFFKRNKKIYASDEMNNKVYVSDEMKNKVYVSDKLSTRFMLF